MKRARRIAYWLAFTAVLYALAWFGHAEGIAGARRVLVFLLAVMALVALPACSDKGRDAAERQGPGVPIGVAVAADLVLAIGLVWYGAIAAAVLLLIVLTLSAVAATPRKLTDL